MKNIFLLFGVLLLLTACSQTQTITTTSGIPQTTQTASSADQIKADALAKNDITQNLVIPLNIKKGKASDTFVFGSIFNLVNMQSGAYIVKLDFIEGRDSSNNKIELSRDAGNAWVQQQGSFVATETPTYIPLTVKPSSSAQPGTYTYDVFVYKLESGFENKIDSINKKVNVKIE